MIDFLAMPTVVEQPSEPTAAPVSAPYRNGIAALNVARHFPARLVRDGSMSFRDIPSLMAGERVAYKA